MADPTADLVSQPKSKKSAASTTGFSTKVEMSKLEVPNMEMPTAFRELAEQTIAQTKGAYEKVKTATEQASNVMEDTYSAALKGYADYGFKLIETARTNSNTAFDLFGELLAAKSYSEIVEKSTAYTRTQLDALVVQNKELSERAQKICADTIAPIRKGFSSFTKSV